MPELLKIQRFWKQATVWVHLGIARLPHQPAADERTIVVAWTAQLKPNPQSGTTAPTFRQNPTATGVEQIAAMDQRVINPDPDLLRPPAEDKTLLLMGALMPVRWPADQLLNRQPHTTPGPDQ